jgi:hypothetical protein
MKIPCWVALVRRCFMPPRVLQLSFASVANVPAKHYTKPRVHEGKDRTVSCLATHREGCLHAQ